MDEQLVISVLTTLPNLSIAVLMLFWQRRTIDLLLENQNKLIERLVKYADHERVTATASGGGDAIIESQ